MTGALPPETLEGWYALHQIFSVDRAALRGLTASECVPLSAEVDATLKGGTGGDDAGGWSAFVPLVGARADVMVIHFRHTLDRIGIAQNVPSTVLGRAVHSFLSMTEAGLYQITSQLAREAVARGGKVGDEQFTAELRAKREAERAADHVKRRLYPPYRGAEMPYVCFYPMDKKRDAGQNWYTLSLDERSELMRSHEATGRRYAGRVQQIITGAIGLDAWEWGVTLFATDPLDFKKLVTDMRFDDVSAKYATFGDLYVGKVATPKEWLDSLRIGR